MVSQGRPPRVVSPRLVTVGRTGTACLNAAVAAEAAAIFMRVSDAFE